MPENPSLSNTVHRRFSGHASGESTTIPGPSEMHRKSRGARFDFEAQSSLRHEVHYAGVCVYIVLKKILVSAKPMDFIP